MTTEQTITINGEEYEIANYTDATPALPDIDWAEWCGEGCTEVADNGIDACYRYDLGNGLSLYIDREQGAITAISISRDTMIEHMQEWWSNITDGSDEQAEWLAAWGLNALSTLVIAKPGDEGPFRVWCEPQYFPGTCNAPLPRYAHKWATDAECVTPDDDLGIAEFDTYEQAQAYIDEYYSAPSRYDGIPACNVMSHGQAGPDRLSIVRAD